MPQDSNEAGGEAFLTGNLSSFLGSELGRVPTWTFKLKAIHRKSTLGQEPRIVQNVQITGVFTFSFLLSAPALALCPGCQGVL